MRPLGALLLAALLLAPVAGAFPPRDLHAEVLAGAAIGVHLVYAGKVTGSAHAARDGRTSDARESYDVHWTLDGLLEQTEPNGTALTGSFDGNWTILRAGMTSVEHETSPGYELDKRTVCEAKEIKGEHAASAEATLLLGDVLALRLMPAGDALGEVEDGCRIAGRQVLQQPDGSHETPLDGNASWSYTFGLLPTTSGDDGVPRPLEMQVQLNALTLQPASLSWTLPAASDAPGRFCGDVANGFVDGGACAVQGRLNATVLLSPCVVLRPRVAADIAALEAVAPPPANADASGIRAWTNATEPILSRAFEETREFIVFGCARNPADEPNPGAGAMRVAQMARDAWSALSQRAPLSLDDARAFLVADRTLEFLGQHDVVPGIEGAYEQVRKAAFERPERLVVAARSPVTLSALNETGARIVATEDEGGTQILRLPMGVWRIELHELGDAPYGFDAHVENATSPPAPIVLLGHGTADRIDVIPLAFWPTSEGVSLAPLPVPRAADGVPSPTPAASATPASATRADTPGPGVAIGLLAVAALALAGRRPR